MNSDGILSWLLQTALHGLNPSLIGTLNVSNPAILRIGNFPVHIQVTNFGVQPLATSPNPATLSPARPRLTLEDPQNGKVIASLSQAGAADQDPLATKERQRRIIPAPVRYRLCPHLVFDGQGQGKGEHELEIAPWIKVVVFGHVERVDFSTLGPRRSTQRVHFDRNDPHRLKAIGLSRISTFGSNRQTTRGKREHLQWSYEHLPLGTATAVTPDPLNGSADPMLLTVDPAIYDAAWRLTGTDRRLDVFPQHFLLLRERTDGANNDL